MSRNEKLMTLGWMAMGAFFAYWGWAFYGVGWFNAPEGGFFPFWGGLILMSLSAVHLLSQRKPRPGEEKPLLRQGYRKSLILTFLSLVAYALLLKWLGFLLTTFLFMGFLLRVITPQKWKVAVGFSVLTALLAYALFVLWLGASLPEGILSGYLPL
jgi:putative tricarboxylic transport membrane protein